MPKGVTLAWAAELGLAGGRSTPYVLLRSRFHRTEYKIVMISQLILNPDSHILDF